MKRFILLSFIFMGWAFYEFSGGAEFEPQTPARLAKYDADEKTHDQAAQTTTAQKTAQAATTPPTTPQPEETVTASLDVSDSQAVLASSTGNKPLRLAPRPSLFSAPSPTPASELAIVSVSHETATAIPGVETSQVAQDLRTVRSARVNMRNGPGTQYSVLGKLKRGDKVHVLQEPGNGWVKLKALDGGRIGWMSASLLANAD